MGQNISADAYLRELWEAAQRTSFWERGKENRKTYSEGMDMLVSLFTEKKKNGKMIFFIGNGGSSAIASHMTADFMKNGGMKTYSLYDNAVLTCMGNDYGYKNIFSKPLGFLANQDDLLVAISSSGNSSNIITAIDMAKEGGVAVLTFTGFKEDNLAKSLGDYNVYVPCEKYGMVETVHNMILQQVVDTIMERDGVSI